jgi:hypothetical protein
MIPRRCRPTFWLAQELPGAAVRFVIARLSFKMADAADGSSLAAEAPVAVKQEVADGDGKAHAIWTCSLHLTCFISVLGRLGPRLSPSCRVQLHSSLSSLSSGWSESHGSGCKLHQAD